MPPMLTQDFATPKGPDRSLAKGRPVPEAAGRAQDKKIRNRVISVVSRRVFLLYEMKATSTSFCHGPAMLFLSRRKMLAGASATLAAGLAGCNSTPAPTISAAATPVPPPPPPAARSAAVDGGPFNYSAIYAENEGRPIHGPHRETVADQSDVLAQDVAYATKESPGTIVVDPGNHFLYHVEDGGRATRYGVGVGREGFVWVGDATIKSKQEWPDWYPPKEMIERRPDLKKEMVDLQSGVGMHGGPANPLGARAMYLWQGDHDTLFRIHGTNEPWTIGLSQSSGCIRMINQDAIDLYQNTPAGTRVVVLASRGAVPVKLART